MDAFMAHKTMCMACHKKHDTAQLDKLHRMRYETTHKQIAASNERHHSFMWGIYSHCPYGIACSDLNRTDSQANQIARELEPYLITIAQNDDETLYHQMLQYLRGDFPSVYHTLERIHNTKKENESC